MADGFPVEWTGRLAVVTLPEHVGVSNSAQLRDQLLAVINRGAAVLIVDMTVTASCDHAALDAVARAYQRAAVSGTQLRLVVAAPVIRRVLGIEGLDRLVLKRLGLLPGQDTGRHPAGGRAGYWPHGRCHHPVRAVAADRRAG
jgi:anti-anti-sigma factor